ncbi:MULTISPECIES: SGNH/GDSL hydrolase family protein [Leptospira]|uniref:SGNH/GDSL hydrolase family protein n=1 Tax=Leptospira TaxID=171 RepID=UPI001FCA2840|nr:MULTISPECIES: SGNH/GDSL hydrolase family protein [Leptospira]
MKKANDFFLNPSLKLRVGFLILCFLLGLFLFCRSIDSISLYFDSDYGHFHFPINSEIPFYRLGNKEIGKIGEWGTRIGELEKNVSCKYLLLGDSQVFGSGIFWKDTFSEILNRETKCHWVNLGIPGFTLENELSLYQKVRTKISFDRVYLFVYGNDIYETGDTPDFLNFVKKQTWYFRILSFLFPEQSRIYGKRKYFQMVQVRMETELMKLAPSNTQVIHKSTTNEKEFITQKALFSLSPDYFHGSLNTKSIAKKNFQRWYRILRKLNDEIVSANKELVIVYIPLEVEYDPEMFQVYKDIGFVMDSSWIKSNSELITDLNIITKEKNIPLIDLREYMRFRSDLLQLEDIHLNETAHRLIADILKKKP